MNKNKFTAILLTLMIALSTSCSNSNVSENTTDETSDEETAVSSENSESQADESYEIDGTYLNFSDSEITFSDSATGFEIDGTNLTIKESGTYILTGNCSNGSVKVKKGTTGVTLVLNGLTLSNETTAPIVCAKSSEVEIMVIGDNILTDSEQNNDDNFPENEDAENSVMKFKDGSNVTISGDGKLYINANGKNGIKAGESTDEEGEASLTIKGLTLNISAVNDAVNAGSTLNILDADITISAGDDALHSDYTLNIGAELSEPQILINECYEGLEGATINIYSGNITIHAQDDCVNAANSDLDNYDFAINIFDGKLSMDTSSGDGIDSNGTLKIEGGEVIVWTANIADNQPLDADGDITISGGTVLAAGASAGMGLKLTANQPCIIYSLSKSENNLISKNDTVKISDGSEIYSSKALTDATFVFFSSADITEDTGYSLVSDSAELATTKAQTGNIIQGISMGGFGHGGNDKAMFGKDSMFDHADPKDMPSMPEGIEPGDMQIMPGEMPNDLPNGIPSGIGQGDMQFDPNDLPEGFDPNEIPDAKPDMKPTE